MNATRNFLTPATCSSPTVRFIGRSSAGFIVGCAERRAGAVLCLQLDPGLRIVAQAVVEGFREAAAWLRALGAATLELAD